MLTSLRTYRLPATFVVLTMAFGVLSPLVEHACAWVNVSGMMASMELPCHDKAEAAPVSHETDMPCHDAGASDVQIASGSPGQPGCCLVTAEQPVVEGVRVTAPTLEHVVVLVAAYTFSIPSEERQPALSARDTGIDRPSRPSPLHILHASLLI